MPLSLDPETVTLLRETLDDAWSCLRPEQQATMQKTALAVRILKSAAQGERDRSARDAALDLAVCRRANCPGSFLLAGSELPIENRVTEIKVGSGNAFRSKYDPQFGRVSCGI
jgi:hypothetical protein